MSLPSIARPHGRCPFCGSRLSGSAQVDSAGAQTLAFSCPHCGPFALTPDLARRADALGRFDRERIADLLALAREVSGGRPFRLRPEHLDG